MDIAPFVENGRTLFPIRYVGYSLGVEPQDILWYGNNETASLFKKDAMVQFKIGETAVYRSGIMIAIDTAAQIREGRVMVPIRAIAEAFGAKVEWEEATQTVRIALNNQLEVLPMRVRSREKRWKIFTKKITGLLRMYSFDRMT